MPARKSHKSSRKRTPARRKKNTGRKSGGARAKTQKAQPAPAKVLIVNENADYFWLDWGHWRTIGHFVLYRAGLTGASVVPTLARLLFFPVTLAYLLLYTGAVHFRRRIRML